ncbi:MAG TPA: alpha/beta hydrolase [Mucilaginibacter sp.]|jgi:acetyl esterase/lipase
MRRYILFVFLIFTLRATGQHVEWRTGVRDTSYNTMSDCRKNSRQYPFIRIVPDSATSAVKETRNLVYCQIGDRQLHIDAFIPAISSKTATPGILIIHGGGWRSGDRSQHIPLAQHLAALGYACFTVEYRLSTEAFYPAAINDVKSAVQWVRANAKKFHINPDQLTIVGFSAGGQMAALTGVTSGYDNFDKNDCNKKQSSAVQAVVDIDGVLSFVHTESSEFKNQQQKSAAAQWIGYFMTERPDLWKEASPLTYAADNKVPFLFLNSSVERMHAGRDDFKKLMDEKGIYTRVINFKDTPHSFCLYYPWFNLVVADIDAFLKSLFK